MRILVCGGREFTDKVQLYRTLDFYGPTCIGEGDANGADKLGGQYAKDREIPLETYPANWKKHGKAAGPIRNKEMLEMFNPDRVIAFKGGNGTADMVRRSKKAGVMTIEVKPRPKCFILVGLPGSGKSTWADENASEGTWIFSTDHIVEEICERYRMTYNQGWSKLIDFATAVYNKDIDFYFAVDDNKDVIFDRTNLTKKSRKTIIDRFKKTHEIIVKEFWIDEEIRRERCAARIGKSVPDSAIEDMKRNYQPFTEDEVN